MEGADQRRFCDGGTRMLQFGLEPPFRIAIAAAASGWLMPNPQNIPLELVSQISTLISYSENAGEVSDAHF